MNDRRVPNLSQYPKMLFQQGYQPGIYYDMLKAQGVPWENLLINLPLFNRWGNAIGNILNMQQPRENFSTGFSG